MKDHGFLVSNGADPDVLQNLHSTTVSTFEMRRMKKNKVVMKKNLPKLNVSFKIVGVFSVFSKYVF